MINAQNAIILERLNQVDQYKLADLNTHGTDGAPLFMKTNVPEIKDKIVAHLGADNLVIEVDERGAFLLFARQACERHQQNLANLQSKPSFQEATGFWDRVHKILPTIIRDRIFKSETPGINL